MYTEHLVVLGIGRDFITLSHPRVTYGTVPGVSIKIIEVTGRFE